MGFSALSRFGRLLAYSRVMGPTRALPWALAFAVVCTATPASALPILSIANAPETVAPGASFSVDVFADMTNPDEGFDVFDLYAYGFGIAFDPAVLAAQAVLEGDFITTTTPDHESVTFFPGIIDNATGTISFITNSLEGDVPGATGAGLLVSLRFTALALGSSPIAITFDPIFNGDALLNSQLVPLNAPTLVGATVAVADPTAVPEPGTLLLLGIAAGLAAAGRRRISRT
jgi:PEP-CTERM motif